MPWPVLAAGLVLSLVAFALLHAVDHSRNHWSDETAQLATAMQQRLEFDFGLLESLAAMLAHVPSEEQWVLDRVLAGLPAGTTITTLIWHPPDAAGDRGPEGPGSSVATVGSLGMHPFGTARMRAVLPVPPPGEGTQRAENAVRGYLRAEMDPSPVLRPLTERHPGVRLALYDRAGDTGTVLLFPEFPSSPDMAHWPRRDIRVGERRWELALAPASSRTALGWLPWLALVSGLGLTVGAALHRMRASTRDGSDSLAPARRHSPGGAALEQVAATIDHILWLADGDLSRLEYISPAYARLWGRTVDSLRSRSAEWTLGLHEADRDRVLAALRQLPTRLKAEAGFSLEFRIIRPDGTLRWVLARGYAVRGAGGRLVRVAGVLEDVTGRKQREAALRHLAEHDLLTGLPNRALFKDRLDQALMHARRHGRNLAVFYLDLDDFKGVNDTLGHEQGDCLLRQVAGRLQQCVRGEDTVARMSGDEFTVLLWDIREPGDAERVARKICRALDAPIPLGEHGWLARASIGISIFPWDGEDADTLLRQADQAMYRAKQQGKRGYRFHCPPAP